MLDRVTVQLWSSDPNKMVCDVSEVWLDTRRLPEQIGPAIFNRYQSEDWMQAAKTATYAVIVFDDERNSIFVEGDDFISCLNWIRFLCNPSWYKFTEVVAARNET